jgi:hypothetical protein
MWVLLVPGTQSVTRTAQSEDGERTTATTTANTPETSRVIEPGAAASGRCRATYDRKAVPISEGAGGFCSGRDGRNCSTGGCSVM